MEVDTPPPASGGVQFVEFLRSRNHRGETCLHEAVRMGHTKLVSLLVKVDAKVMSTSIVSTPTLVQIVDDEGTSPLYLATTLGHKDIVEALTTNTSANNNHYPAASSAGPAGKTALHAAVVVSRGIVTLMSRHFHFLTN
jgi:ankyrin repeat protein